MIFIESLRAYLEQVKRAPGGLWSGEIPPEELAGYHQHLIEGIDRVGDGRTKRLAGLYRSWKTDDRLRRFLETLIPLLDGSFSVEEPETRRALVNAAIHLVMGLKVDKPGGARQLELKHLADQAWQTVQSSPDGVGRGNVLDERRTIVLYAREIRLTRLVGDRVSLTPIGRVFLELMGREAVQWLLILETLQSLGSSDPWRLSIEAIGRLVQEPETLWWMPEGSAVWSPMHRDSFTRLIDLNILKYNGPEYLSDLGAVVECFKLETTLLELLRPIAERKETPLSLLASTLLNDESSKRLDHLQPASPMSVASDISARQSRMVAHEIRNALVPVSIALDEMFAELRREHQEKTIAQFRTRIDSGLDRVFKFVSDMVRISTLPDEPTELLELSPILSEAIGLVRGGFGLDARIEFTTPSALPRLRGHRWRLVRAFVSILQNAGQSLRDQPLLLRVTAESMENHTLRILIDDNGPGIPEAYRTDVFKEGFTLRSGGSGLGLALVREVIEGEMEGRVECESSPLGGARFIISVPARSGGEL